MVKARKNLKDGQNSDRICSWNKSSKHQTLNEWKSVHEVH